MGKGKAMREKKYFFSLLKNLKNWKRGADYNHAWDLNLDSYIKESFNHYKSTFRARLSADFQNNLRERFQTNHILEKYQTAGLGIGSWKDFLSKKDDTGNRVLGAPLTFTVGRLALGIFVFFLLPLSIFFIYNSPENTGEPGLSQGISDKSTAKADLDLMFHESDCDDSANAGKKIMRHPSFNFSQGIQMVNNTQGTIYEAEAGQDLPQSRSNIGYLYLTDFDCTRPGDRAR
jgi:hypothetical protein